MQLYFLGTGAGSPSSIRNVSGVLIDVQQECSSTWLFDCGEATQHQMLSGQYSPRKLDKIFLSHLHGDHIFGLLGVIDSRSMQGATTPLTIYAPIGVREYIEVSLRISHSHLNYQLNIVDIYDGMQFFDDHFSFECKQLAHVIPSFGWRISERAQAGTLDIEALLHAKIPVGAVYAKIKRGETVQLPDGRIIDGKQFVLPAKPGRVITLIGDTGFCQNSVELAHNANVLLHEATFVGSDYLSAQKYGHSCAADAAKVAKLAGAKQLIISHISARYDKNGLLDLLNEAKQILPEVIMAHDFMRFQVNHPSN